MKRVLLTLYSTSWGGAEESILSLARKLKKLNFDIYVLFISKYSVKFDFDKDIKIFRLKINPSLYKILAPYIVTFLCLKYKIKLVNLNWRFVYEESRFLRFFKIKSIATIRAILIDKNNAGEYKNTDAIIGISQAVIDRIKELGYKKPCYLIYNGIDLENFKLFHNYKKDPYKFFTLSRLVKWKRIDWAVLAAYNLRSEGIQIQLDIYGSGPEEENLKTLINKLKANEYIKIKGWIDKNDVQLSEYGIFLIPSFAEPFGKTVVENVIRGKVIVGTNYGGIPELLPNYKLLFERDDFDDFIIKIKLALKNYSEWEKEIIKRQPWFIKYFNMERVAKEYKKIYEIYI